MTKNEEIAQRVHKEISKLNDKDFTVFFFTLDSKGTPSGAITYVYELALELQKKGFNVKILHQEKEFVGVGEWLGEEYANLPHANIEEENLAVSTSDFLLIPEVFSTVMNQTKKLPCKRIAIMQNYNYLTEFIPLGAQWANFGIQDAIASSETQANLIKSVFPYIKTKVLEPKLAPYFRKGIEPKKLIVNVITKDQTDVNRIIKPFYWKFPICKWVSFRDLRGFPKEQFSDLLREGAITVWVDDDAQFGYAPLEAMRSGAIVIGKIPDIVPEWMLNDDKSSLANNGIWFDDITDVHKIIYSVIKSWINDDIPNEITTAMDKTNEKYTSEKYSENLSNIFEEYIEDRKKEFNEFLNSLEENNNTNKENE